MHNIASRITEGTEGCPSKVVGIEEVVSLRCRIRRIHSCVDKRRVARVEGLYAANQLIGIVPACVKLECVARKTAAARITNEDWETALKRGDSVETPSS